MFDNISDSKELEILGRKNKYFNIYLFMELC